MEKLILKEIIELIPLYRDEINNKLYNIYQNGPNSLAQPINYVLKGGGKRLRPILTIFSAEACGSTKENAISALYTTTKQRFLFFV